MSALKNEWPFSYIIPKLEINRENLSSTENISYLLLSENKSGISIFNLKIKWLYITGNVIYHVTSWHSIKWGIVLNWIKLNEGYVAYIYSKYVHVFSNYQQFWQEQTVSITGHM